MNKRAAAAELVKKQSHISVQRYFETSLLLMLTTGFVTVATTRKLDLLSTVLVLAALLVKLLSYLRGAGASLAPRTVTRLAIFYMFFYVLDFFIFTPGPGLIDHMLGATVHLVLFATVVKVFSAVTYRDYGYLATLSFLMMLASAILTVSTVYLACFACYAVFSISTFVSYEIKRGIETSARPSEGPFAAPDENRKSIEKALGASSLCLAIGTAALASLLFFVIPRYRTGYLTGLGTERQNITGFSESVNLGDIRKILKSNQVVMRVVVQGTARDFQGVKWRGVALTSFDGQHWYNDNTEQTALLPAYFGEGAVQHFLLPRAEGWQIRARRQLRYHVLLSSITSDLFFAAAVPRQLSGHMRFLSLDETLSLHNPQHGYAPVGYEATSDTGLPSPAELRGAPAVLPPEIALLYLRLPPKTDPRVAALAKSVTANAGNNFDRARALEGYLRNEFAYSLDPPSIEPSDPIGSFLFKSKKGYCEFFAAAMVVMLRTIGIPARIVNGFQTGLYNRFGKDFVVRARDAHSWVEVYFPGYDWVPFDPTPPDPNAVGAEEWGFFDDYLDAASLFWSEWVINYDFSRQVELARDVEQGSRRMQVDLHQRFRDWQRHAVTIAFRVEGWMVSHKLAVLLLMLAVLAAVIIAEGRTSVAELRFAWAWRFGAGRDRLLAAREAVFTYQRFLKVAEKKGYRKPDSRTPREFAQSLAGGPIGRLALEFTRLYNALRFGREPVALGELRALLEQIAKA